MISVQDLRKIYSAQGIKGFSSANRAAFNADIEAAHELALLSENSRESAKQVKPVRKGGCEDCGRKVNKQVHPDLCEVCYDFAGWENTHSDSDHAGWIASGKAVNQDLAMEIADCPVCHPELDKRFTRREGRSRAGMEIVARGTEVHKSETFKVAAEAAGWTVEIHTETYEGGNTRHYADATKDGNAIQLAWDGRAYDYPASSARIGGKDRKVRNLKEALRLLAI